MEPALPDRRELRRTMRAIVDGFAEHRLLTYASAIAYQVMSALIPFALFSLGLVGSLNLEETWTQDAGPQVHGSVSPQVWSLIDSTVRQIFEHKQLFWVTIGFVVMLWELSGAVRATMEALDHIHRTESRRSRTDRYATSVGIALAVGALTLLAVGAIVAGRVVFGGPVSLFVRYAVAAVLLAIAVGLVLRAAPAAEPPVAWVSAGSIVIVVGWLVVVGGYVFYASRIASYGSVFGSLSVVFVLIVAAYLSAAVFLTGALLDALARDEED